MLRTCKAVRELVWHMLNAGCSLTVHGRYDYRLAVDSCRSTCVWRRFGYRDSNIQVTSILRRNPLDAPVLVMSVARNLPRPVGSPFALVLFPLTTKRRGASVGETILSVEHAGVYVDDVKARTNMLRGSATSCYRATSNWQRVLTVDVQ